MDRVSEALEIVRRAKALGDYDTNVIGMAAEIVAEEEFGMHKAPRGTKGIDGYFRRRNSERTVQVKSFSCSRVVTYKKGAYFWVPVENCPDHLIVILFYCQLAEFEVLYSGDPRLVGKVQRNGKRRGVRLDSLKSEGEISSILKKIGASDDG